MPPGDQIGELPRIQPADIATRQRLLGQRAAKPVKADDDIGRQFVQFGARLGRRQRKEIFDQRDPGRLNRYNRRTAAKLVQPRFQIFDRIIRRQLEWRLQRAMKPHPAGQGGNECMVLFHQPFDRLAHLCPRIRVAPQPMRRHQRQRIFRGRNKANRATHDQIQMIRSALSDFYDSTAKSIFKLNM